METSLSFSEREAAATTTGKLFTLKGFEALEIPCSDVVSEQTRRVILQHVRDFSALDIEGLMRHYAPTCRLGNGLETRAGTDAIRAYYSHILEQLAATNTTLRLLQLDIDRKAAFLTWEQYSDRQRIPFGATTFIVVDGLIVRQQLIACECRGGVCIHLY